MRGKLGRVGAATVLAVGVMLTPSTAYAHSGDPSNASNYHSEVTSVRPQPSAVDIEVIDVGTRLALTVHGTHTVVVQGYENEQYLRIDPGGVWENTRSPATYLNRDRYARTQPPTEADARAVPMWQQASTGHTARWHDHRIHWMSTQPPPMVRADPDRPHTIIDPWQIPLQVDGSPVTVSGRLTWEPGPATTPWTVLIVLLAAATGVAAFLRRSAIVAGAAVAAAAVAAHELGLIVGSDRSLWQAVRLLALPAIAIGLATAAGFVLRRSLPWCIALADASLIATLVVAGRDLVELGRSQVPGTLAPPLARLLVALPIGVAAGILIATAASAVMLIESATGARSP